MLCGDVVHIVKLDRARCAKKKAEFEKRNMLRSQEEAAIAEAIAVLNSDAAFATFGTVRQIYGAS